MNERTRIMIELTRSGSCKIRRDLKKLKILKKIQQKEKIVLTKRVRALLGYWTIKKIKLLLGREVSSIEEGLQAILGMEISQEQFNSLFEQSALFERLAERPYKKTKEKIISSRLKREENREKRDEKLRRDREQENSR